MPKEYRKDDPEYNRKMRNRGRKRNYDKSRPAKNSRAPWTKSDIEMVLAHEIKDRELAEILGRSVQSVQMARFVFTHGTRGKRNYGIYGNRINGKRIDTDLP